MPIIFRTAKLPDLDATGRQPAVEGAAQDDTAPTLSLKQGQSAADTLHDRRYHGAEEADYYAYQVVPAKPAAGGPRWRIELVFEDPRLAPIKLEVAGTAIVGRSSSADVDLDPYDAATLGVSRRHAMLRASPRALYLFDLESTNGTRYNGVLVPPGVVCTLGLNDTVRMGKLQARVRRIEQVHNGASDHAGPQISAAGQGSVERD